MWRIFPLDIFSAHLSCGEISPRDRFSPPFSCGEIFHLTDLSPHFSCGEISPCDRVSPHLSSGEFSHLTCHGENFSTWPIFSPQTASVASVTNIRYVHTVCTNFGLNVHTVCTNFGLNVHTPVYKIKIRKCMCTLRRASEKAPGWSSMTWYHILYPWEVF